MVAKPSPPGDGEPQEVVRRLTAAFSDRATENAYRAHLASAGFHHELRLQLAAIGVFLSYGVLDFLVVSDFSAEFLTLRFLIVAPIVGLCVAVTALPKMRRYVEYSTTFGFGVFAAAIIYMIYRMPVDGAPPYIIGLLVVMIFTSCLMRISFLVAAPTYFMIGVAYCWMLLVREETPPTQIISGLFFMISVAGIAIVTVYVEEIRSREIWLRNAQRRADAARIERLLVDATAADQSKLNFLTILTHELRTPLHQIIGFGEVLKSAAATTGNNEGETIENIIAPAKGLLKKLGQMLRYADATAGKLTFYFDDVSIRELVETAAEQLFESAAAKAVKIDISGVSDCSLHIDQHHTLFALTSLVENALAASPAGTTVTITGVEEQDGPYLLTIRDAGCGMTEKQIAAAFSPFEQNEAVRSRSRDGLGLGLTIAQRLLTEQRASLKLQSVVDAGTAVLIAFETPAMRSAQTPADPAPVAIGRGA